MKSIRMQTFTILTITILLTGLQLVTGVEFESRDDILDYFKRQMSMLNFFDFCYDSALRDVKLVNRMEPAAQKYSLNVIKTYTPESKPENFFARVSQYKCHYIYFASTATMNKSKEESFVEAYVAYFSFWASIYFRVGAMYHRQAITFTPKSDAEDAEKCNRLHIFLHWFTFAKFEKITEFRNTGRKDSENEISVHHVADIMMKLDLDFIMDAQYLMETHPFGFSILNNIIDWRKVPNQNESSTSIRTLFPSDEVKRMERKENEQDVFYMERENGELHDKLWGEVINSLKNEILDVENFFHNVIMGRPLDKSKLNMKIFIPKFDLSLNIWKKVNQFIEIRNLSSNDRRKTYGQTGNEIHRSNPVEIIRYMLEIQAEYNLGLLPRNDLSPGPIQLSASNYWEDISYLKDPPTFHLSISDSKYEIDYKLEI